MLDLPTRLGKYRIQSVLGQGAMGVVYQAKDPDIQRLVAIKVIHAHLLQGDKSGAFHRRFRREAQAAARCHHPNIVTVYELGEHEGRDFIVMEYVQGQELKYFLDRKHRFSQDESLFIVGEILKALTAAHEQAVVHRDVKPANVILLDDGGVKVADFGVARTRQSDLTLAGNLVGTPGYMCPEGLMGEAVDHRADIYSTGMLLLELLAGDKPTSQQRCTEKAEDFLLRLFARDGKTDLSPGMKYLLHRALAEDRDKRFQTTRDFLQALEKVRQKQEPRPMEAVRTLAESVTRVRPEHKGPEPFVWTRELLGKLERELTAYVGPLAGMLIKKAAGSGLTPMEVVANLAGHIHQEAERDAFIKKARLCMALGSCAEPAPAGGSRGTDGTGTSLAESLPPERVEHITRVLAEHVGPLARQLVNLNARRFSRLEELHRKLADSIPDSAERRDFLRAVRERAG